MRGWMSMIVMLMLASSSSRAEEFFRCGNWLVSRESTVEEVLKKCGEPTYKRTATEPMYATLPGGGTTVVGTITKEVWTYDRGSRAFAMIVKIVNGDIESMTHGD